MKQLRIILLLLAASLITGCGKEGISEIYTDVTIILDMPDGSGIVSLAIDNTVEGNFLRNMNTLREYNFPVFTSNTATIRLLKGIYVIGFDGTAILSDGTVRTVRSAQYHYPEKAVILTGGNETLTLKLTVLR